MDSFTMKERAILDDPAASYWLKSRLRELAERDPVDALHDLEALIAVQKEKLGEPLIIPAQAMGEQ